MIAGGSAGAPCWAMLLAGAAWVLVSSPSQIGDARAMAIARIIARNKKTSNLGLEVFLNECVKVLLLLIYPYFSKRIYFSHPFLIR